MNKQIRWLITIILGLLLIAVLVYLFLLYKVPASSPTDAGPSAQIGGPASTGKFPSGTTAIEPVSPITKHEVTQTDLARMAAAFAERFGSFSNQSDYGNFRDLQIFETAAMQAWAQNYISQAKAKKADTSVYYGIVTKSIVTEVKQFDSSTGQAEILVKTQRRETAGTSAASPAFYQDIIIKYLLEGGVWRVDSAEWQGGK